MRRGLERGRLLGAARREPTASKAPEHDAQPRATRAGELMNAVSDARTAKAPTRTPWSVRSDAPARDGHARPSGFRSSSARRACDMQRFEPLSLSVEVLYTSCSLIVHKLKTTDLNTKKP